MSRAAVSEDLRLAISYRDYWLVVMSGTFVGGYAILLLVICLWIFVMLQFGQTLLPFALQRSRERRRS